MTAQNRQTVEQVPDWPVLDIVVDAEGHGSINGKTVVAAGEDAARNELLAEATRCAGVIGRPLRVRALDPRGEWHLIAYPDGAVIAVLEGPRAAVPAPASEPAQISEPAVGPDPAEPGVTEGDDAEADEDQADEDDPDPGSLHLRVHPDGSITPLDDLESQPFPAPRLQRPQPPPPPPALVRAPAPQPEPEPPAGLTPEPAQQWSPPLEPVPDEQAPERPPLDKNSVAWALRDGLGSTLLGHRAAASDDHFSLDDSSFERSSFDQPPFDQPPFDDDPPRDRPAETHRLTTPDAAPGEGPSGRSKVRRRAKAASRYDTTPADAAMMGEFRSGASDEPKRTSGLGRWLRPAAVVAAAGVAVGAFLLVGGTGGSAPPDASTAPIVVRRSATPTAPARGAADVAPSATTSAASLSPSPASPPARLTGGAPPGFTASPLWGVPVASASTALVGADGRVLALTADHQVALVDPADGTLAWHVQAPSGATGLNLATIDGHSVAAVVTPDTLTYWSLPVLRSAAGAAALAPVEPSDPVTVRLATGAALSWAGPSPLVTLPDGTAGVIRGGEVQRVSLPTGLRPLAADGADVLAVQGRAWIRQRAGQAPGPTMRLTAPPKATGTAPIRVENIGGSFLAGVWTSASGPVVAVYDAHTGAVAVQATFPRASNFLQATTVRQPGGDRTAIGPALLEPAQQNLSILSPDFTPVALAPGHVYADDVNGGVVDLQIKGPSFKIVPFAGKSQTVPIGITTVASQSRAVVVVPVGSGWLLCALPST